MAAKLKSSPPLVKAEHFKKGLPNGSAITDGNFTSDTKVVTPVDLSVPRISQEVTTKMDLAVAQPNDAGTVAIKIEFNRTEERSTK